MTRRGAIVGGLGIVGSASGQQKGKMTNSVRGEFDVKLTPQGAADAAVGRMSLVKQFHGALEAASVGEMLAIRADKGSAGYVAMERVTGTLEGRKGSFALQHSGTMNRGTGTLAVHVVPDSGTEELAGLSGKMGIEITGGKHLYSFDYEIG